MRHILIISPDCQLAYTLRKLLGDEGYGVDVVPTGSHALRQLNEAAYDLLLLDRDLTDMEGLDLCRRIREQSSSPLLILSTRNDTADRIAGLKAGADDYLGKPIEPSELLARTWATLRWNGATTDPHLPRDFQLGLTTNTVVRTHDGVQVKLTPSEMRLLHFLVSHPGRGLSVAVLVIKVWGFTAAPDQSRLKKVMARLWEKLELDPKHPKLLLTVPGIGYRYSPSHSE